jgi:hypothetical protein
MAQRTDRPEGGRRIDPILLSSQTARQLVRLAANKSSEYDLYDKYMNTVGKFLMIPNPKGDVARNLIALREAKLLADVGDGVLAATPDALRQVQGVPFEDLTVDLVESVDFRANFSAEMSFFQASIACCSTSTSCKCSSSSCSSSIEIGLLPPI